MAAPATAILLLAVPLHAFHLGAVPSHVATRSPAVTCALAEERTESAKAGAIAAISGSVCAAPAALLASNAFPFSLGLRAMRVQRQLMRGSQLETLEPKRRTHRIGRMRTHRRINPMRRQSLTAGDFNRRFEGFDLAPLTGAG